MLVGTKIMSCKAAHKNFGAGCRRGLHVVQITLTSYTFEGLGYDYTITALLYVYRRKIVEVPLFLI